MPIKRDSKLSVGNSDIDTEHKLIIAHTNALERVLRHPDAKDYLPFFIDQLFELTTKHFYYEEQLQLKFMYPYYEENKKGQQALMRKWFIDPIVKTDMKMKGFMDNSTMYKSLGVKL